MAFRLKRILTTSYAVAIILACFFLSALTVAYAWRQGGQSRGNIVFSALFAGFFLYAAIVLLFQAIQERRYQRALDALGFLPFDWKQVPIQQVVASLFAQGRKAFLSRGYQGQSVRKTFTFSTSRPILHGGAKDAWPLFYRSPAGSRWIGLVDYCWNTPARTWWLTRDGSLFVLATPFRLRCSASG
jgi:hypothetical protein